MAVIVECNYQKRLGLPNYSSHAYSVTVRTEVSDLNQVESASAHLFRELQDAVDRDIQQTGWLPDQQTTANGNGHSQANGTNGNGGHWNCSAKQKDLILKIVDEHHLDKDEVESLANERFSKSVTALNKMQASGLIDELLESYSTKRNGNGKRHDRSAFGGNRR